jgi:glucosamine--fructose-6-phosphate aminotransferase (isomerizing)
MIPVARWSGRRQVARGAAYVVDKGNHRHFMEKEIHEQAEVVSHTLSNYIDFAEGKVRLDTGQLDFANLDRLAMSACGTAYYAGLIGKYWFERFARLPVEIDVASEFRYREMPIAWTDGGTVHFPVRRDRRHTGFAALLP